MTRTYSKISLEAGRPSATHPMPATVTIDLSSTLLSTALQQLVENASEQFQANLWDGSPPPQLLITDLRNLREHRHDLPEDCRVLIIDTGLTSCDLEKLFLDSQVVGLLQQDTTPEMFEKALRCVIAGELWIDNRSLQLLLRQKRSPERQPNRPFLTRKEHQILDFIMKGYKNKEIAQEVFLSESTVKVHVSKIYRKYDVQRRAQLIGKILQDANDPMP